MRTSAISRARAVSSRPLPGRPRSRATGGPYLRRRARIDAAAHLGALEASGTTIAVLACGADLAYPAGHAERLDAIAGNGAVVSELPPGFLASQARFLARNRVIAALSAGTVVVEASSRSESMSTAEQTRGTGRPVMAVPGPVTSDCSAGCNELIRRGQAVLVTSARDVIDTLTTARSAQPDSRIGVRSPHLSQRAAKHATGGFRETSLLASSPDLPQSSLPGNDREAQMRARISD
jgi:predicted Rossmann fold nucleotide-binding protein DprA/Smf involved in DNA uptake